MSGGVTKGAEKRVQERNPEGAMEEGTEGRSPERKEAAFRYRLQTAAFTRAVAGGLEGAWTMEWLVTGHRGDRGHYAVSGGRSGW